MGDSYVLHAAALAGSSDVMVPDIYSNREVSLGEGAHLDDPDTVPAIPAEKTYRASVKCRRLAARAVGAVVNVCSPCHPTVVRVMKQSCSDFTVFMHRSVCADSTVTIAVIVS